MCTLTWLSTADGYELFFNRDESRARLPALPPRAQARNGVPFLCALDADAGGTWLGVNAFGLSVGVLNGRSDAPAPAAPRSRGLLVLDLLDTPDTATLERRLDALDLGSTRAFRLIALEPGARLLEASWDGRELRRARRSESEQPVCSSSLDPEGAAASRTAAWAQVRARGVPDERAHEEFHRGHVPQRGALSACMHRADAETVSFTRTRVSARRVELGYRPGSPCGEAEIAWLALERAAGASRGP